jgi:hypothetical protein
MPTWTCCAGAAFAVLGLAALSLWYILTHVQVIQVLHEQ